MLKHLATNRSPKKTNDEFQHDPQQQKYFIRNFGQGQDHELVAHLALFPRTTRRHVDRITFIPKRNRFRSTDDQHYEKFCRDDRETRNVPSPHSKTSNDGELALKRFMIKVNSNFVKSQLF